ncbi:hypothetical protein SAMN05720615_102442 [Stenotrophomonas indicatrix]|nr:hypothetical protein SAMN05720615_102442 [Stenotrophomonas indicatrix]
MALTPLRNPPARPRTISVRVHHRKEKEKIKSRSGSLRSASTHGVDLLAVIGNCRGWAVWGCRTVGAMGPRHALGRVEQDAQPRSCRVRRTAHTSKAPSSPHGWVNGVSCSPTPPHQTHRNPEPLLQLQLQLQLLPAGAGRQALQKSTTRSPSPRSPAGPAAPATAAASATPGSSHPAGPATAATPAAGPLRCNRAHLRAARH